MRVPVGARFVHPYRSGELSTSAPIIIVATYRSIGRARANGPKVHELGKRMSQNWTVGDTLENRYRVVKRISSGGMGLVFILDDLVEVRRFAAKTFRREIEQPQRGEIEQFTLEALVWASLGIHPHIVTNYGVIHIEQVPFLAMDYVDGGDLAEAIKDQRYTGNLLAACEFGAQFCEALQYACDHGLLAHRDIKPSNCLIGSDDCLRVTDFGVSRLRETSESLDALRFSINSEGDTSNCLTEPRLSGTRQYMAPEQYRNPNLADIRSDVFAFAMSWYELLTGKPLCRHPLGTC